MTRPLRYPDILGSLPPIRVALGPARIRLNITFFLLQSFMDMMMLIFNIDLFMMSRRVAE